MKLYFFSGFGDSKAGELLKKIPELEEMFTLLSKVGEGERIILTISWSSIHTVIEKCFTSIKLGTFNILQEPLAMFTWQKWTVYQMNYVLWSTLFLPVVLEGLKMSLNASKILGMCGRKHFWIIGSWAIQSFIHSFIQVHVPYLV